MKIKKVNEVTAETVKRIFEEELVLTINEDLGSGHIDENMLKHLKSAGKGMFDYYKILMTNYAKMLDQMVNQQLIPSAMADKIEDKLDEPEEVKGEDPGEQADSVGDMGDMMRKTANQIKKAGGDEAAEKVDDMADAAEAVEDAAEEKAEGEGESVGSLRSLDKGKLRVALNQLGNKGLSGDKVGALFDKASAEIVKQAGPMARQVKEEDLPVIDAIKDQVVAILKGDLDALREQKILPGTARFLAHILNVDEKNRNHQLINNKIERR